MFFALFLESRNGSVEYSYVEWSQGGLGGGKHMSYTYLYPGGSPTPSNFKLELRILERSLNDLFQSIEGYVQSEVRILY